MGEPLTETHPVVRAVLARTGDARWRLAEMLERDPRHGPVRALLAWRDARRLTDVRLRHQMVRAQADALAAGTWERSLVHAFNLAAHRHYRAAAEHLSAHLERFPADPLAVPLTGAFDLSEDIEVIDRGRALVERQYAAADHDSWPWAGRLAAIRAEQHRIDEAERLARRALALEPRSEPAAHALAHTAHTRGAGPRYLAFIDAWLAADPCVPQRRHLQWHAALQALACGDVAEARRRADTELQHGDVGIRSALNWRLLLAGQSPTRLVEADHARALLAEPGGMVSVFHTFQLALALAVVGDTPALEQLAATAATDPRPDYHQVLAPVVRALAHLTAGRPGPAVDLLQDLGEQARRLGGVAVEREIIDDTLARALIDAGRPDRAAALLHHRRTTRAHHHYEDRLLTPTPPAAPPAPTAGLGRRAARTHTPHTARRQGSHQ